MAKKITKYKTRYGDTNYKIEEEKIEIITTEVNLKVLENEIISLETKRTELNKIIKDKKALLKEIKEIK